MGGSWRTISVALRADTSGFSGPLLRASQSVKAFEKDTERSTGRARSGWTGFGKAVGLGVAGLAVGFAAFTAKAISSSIEFEKRISAIGAVSGATRGELDALRAKALQLGADTVFSATDAAQAMEELSKAGLSVSDILNGAADATVALAAAGEIDLPQAATIAANAMNAFELSAKQLPHVADLIAGAANASAIDVSQFGFALQAAGAVAHITGLSFDDLTVGIAALGNAGIVGQDAGTSLKSMFLQLTPATAKATTKMKELGIITKDGTNRFFDATGKVKSLSQISGVLGGALGKLSPQLQTVALKTIFGTDAFRAAAIFANLSAKGVDKLTTAIGKVGAFDVAKKRMDNLAGSIEQFKGSLDTLFIKSGSIFTTALRGIVDGATGLVNVLAEPPSGFFDPLIEGAQVLGPAWNSLVGAAENLWQVMQNVWETAQPAVELFAQIAGATIVGGITALAGGLEAVTGFLAQNEWLVRSLVNALTALAAMKAFNLLLLGAQSLALKFVELTNAAIRFGREGMADASSSLSRFGSTAGSVLPAAGVLVAALAFGWVSHLQTMKKWNDTIADGIDQLRDKAKELGGSLPKALDVTLLKEWTDNADQFRASGIRSFTELRKVVTATDREASKMFRLGDDNRGFFRIQQLRREFAGAKSEIDDASDAQKKLAEETAKSTAASGKLGKGVKEVAKNTDLVTKALSNQDYTDKMEKAELSIQDVIAASKFLGISLEEALSMDPKALATARDELAKFADGVRQTFRSFGSLTNIPEELAKSSGGIKLWMTGQFRAMVEFSGNIQKALKMGYNPVVIQDLLVAGPAKAGEVLRTLVANHGGALVEEVNLFSKAMQRQAEVAAEQARLSKIAIDGTQEQVRELGIAMEISARTAMGAKPLTAEELSKQMFGIDPATIKKVAKDFKLTIEESFPKKVPTPKPDLGEIVTSFFGGGKAAGEGWTAGTAVWLPSTVVTPKPDAAAIVSEFFTGGSFAGVGFSAGIEGSMPKSVPTPKPDTPTITFDFFFGGAAAGQGLADGIWSKKEVVAAAAAGIGSEATGALGWILQIDSPSRVTFTIGEQAGLGLVAGLESQRPLVESAAAGLGSALTGSLSGAVSAGVGDYTGPGAGDIPRDVLGYAKGLTGAWLTKEMAKKLGIKKGVEGKPTDRFRGDMGDQFKNFRIQPGGFYRAAGVDKSKASGLFAPIVKAWDEAAGTVEHRTTALKTNFTGELDSTSKVSQVIATGMAQGIGGQVDGMVGHVVGKSEEQKTGVLVQWSDTSLGSQLIVGGMVPAVTSMFDVMSLGVIGAIQGIYVPATTSMQHTMDTMTVAAGIGGSTIAGSLNFALAAGVGAVANTMKVYGATLTGTLNPILAAIGAKTIGGIGAGIGPAGLAEGGSVRGPDTRRDSVPAMLMPGEYVVRRKRVLEEGPEQFEALNRGDATIVPKRRRFAAGGLVPAAQRFATGGAVSSVAGGWQALIDAIVRAGIPHRVTSTVRPGARTHATGAVSLHALGRAVDFGPPGGAGDVAGGMRIFNFFDPLKGISELIYSYANHYRTRGGMARPIAALNPITKADHYDHVHVGTGTGGGGPFTGAGPVPVILAAPPDIKDRGLLGSTATEAMRYTHGLAQTWADQHTAAPEPGQVPGALFAGGASAGAATGWIREALGILKAPAAWLSPLLRRAQQESGFNPRAQNDWDSNARRGTPSQGLFQTIGPTFEANKLPGYDDIWNPVHNAIAAIRYIMVRYGTPFNLPSGGYAEGGLVEPQRLAAGGMVTNARQVRPRPKKPDDEPELHGKALRDEQKRKAWKAFHPESQRGWDWKATRHPGHVPAAIQHAFPNGIVGDLNQTGKVGDKEWKNYSAFLTAMSGPGKAATLRFLKGAQRHHDGGLVQPLAAGGMADARQTRPRPRKPDDEPQLHGKPLRDEQKRKAWRAFHPERQRGWNWQTEGHGHVPAAIKQAFPNGVVGDLSQRGRVTDRDWKNYTTFLTTMSGPNANLVLKFLRATRHADGGMVTAHRRPFDDFGTLARGWNLVQNKTGAPEHLARVPAGSTTNAPVTVDARMTVNLSGVKDQDVVREVKKAIAAHPQVIVKALEKHEKTYA